MDKSNLKFKVISTTQEKKSKVAQTLKLVVFPIGELNVAFSINNIQKVVNYTHVYGSGLTDMGITHLENQEITVIDIHKRLYKKSLVLEENQEKFLIVVKNTQGEIFATIALETPSLIDVSLSDIRVLPESYRQADTLAIASHVIVIPQENENLTVFLLDVDSLI